MKKYGFAIVIIALLVACDDNIDNQINNTIADGYYEGYFDFQQTSYWCLIHFENGKYVEWPSGGAYFQKSMGCLTVGTFSAKNNIIAFELGSFKFEDFPEPCETDMLLPGNYEILYEGQQDSLVFKKGSNESEITYYLKKKE
jgi:hypothetical protein